MSLEQVFKADWTLKKLRSGPLRDFIEGFCVWLEEKKFRVETVRRHLAYVSHLDDYLGDVDPAPRNGMTAEDIHAFFEAYPSRCRNRGPLENHLRFVRFSINRFVEFLDQKGLFDALITTPVHQPLLESYLKWMSDYQHAAPGTLEVRSSSLRKFFEWLGPKATAEQLRELTAEQVETFFIAYAQQEGHAARRSMQSALRTFFRFCRHMGFIERPLDLAVPTLRTYRYSTVPRGIGEGEVKKILESINRDTHVGLRDYAIIRLLDTYGVRGGQVRALCLKDICWEKDRILFRALKHGKDSLLPLTAEVGESLLAYLKNARPACAHPEVFLTCRAPCHALANSSSLSEIVRRYMCAAGIDAPSRGAHVFRHGFATRKVAEGHSLKAIADVLGHRRLSTTFIYTKIDFNALKEVALEWPGEVGA